MKIKKIITFLILGFLTFSFSNNQEKLGFKIYEDDTSIMLNNSQLEITLLKDDKSIPITKNSIDLTIYSYEDSAQFNIKYKKYDITTPFFLFSDIEKLDWIQIKIFTQKYIRKHMKLKKTHTVYNIYEKPKGHGVGRSTQITLKN